MPWSLLHRRVDRRTWRLVAPSLVLVWMLGVGVTPAWAQFGPGGGGMQPGTSPGGPSQAPEEKQEGPAEAAPEGKGESTALQPLPAWPQQREKALQFFQLNGYLRFRAYLFHNLNLGFYQTGNPGTPRNAFYIPYSEIGQNGKSPTNAAAMGLPAPAPSSCAARDNKNCRTDNMTSADMRLRLEPTVNVTEQVRVKAQLDIFDNLVMGSSPDGYFLNRNAYTTDVPTAAAARSQQSPEANSNAVFSSIRAKRAWA